MPGTRFYNLAVQLVANIPVNCSVLQIRFRKWLILPVIVP